MKEVFAAGGTYPTRRHRDDAREELVVDQIRTSALGSGFAFLFNKPFQCLRVLIVGV